MNIDYPLRYNFKLTEIQKKALKKLGLETLRDLLFYFPSRYSDLSELKRIEELTKGETATVYAKVVSAKTKKSFRSKMPMGEALLEDLSGRIKAVWFNQPYIAKMIKVGEYLKLTGKISKGKYGLTMANPEYERRGELRIDAPDSIFGKNENALENFCYPVYPETKGLSSKWIYHAIQKIIKDGVLDNIEDYISAEILKKYNLPSLRTALIWIHMPKNKNDAGAARKRFAFEEVFFIQLERQHDKMEYAKNNAFAIKPDETELELFISRFPFKATKS